jgi:hypothetical protein
MRIVGPQALTVGQSNTVDDPAQVGGNPSVACQVQNSSPYQLNVLAQGDSLSIQPFTAQTIEISGQPITVTPLAGTGSGACSITFVFLLGVAAGTGVQLSDGTWVETPPQQDGPLTAAAITAAFPSAQQVFTNPFFAVGPGGTSTGPITIPTGTRTLVIALKGILVPPAITKVSIGGVTTGYLYYNQAPYLALGTTYLIVTPIVAVADTQVNVTLVAGGGSGDYSITVWGDNAQYDESVFYNGIANQVGFVVGPILNGPARLLTATLYSTANELVAMTIGGQTLLYCENGQETVSFPPNTILPSGQSIVGGVAGGGTAQGGITYAYP